jgi:aquaporin Z
MDYKKLLAEALGTMMLVLIGCGTAAMTHVNGAEINAAYILTALAFGGAIFCVAYSVGKISGGHVNPAVSLGMYFDGRMSGIECCGYILAQVVGAIVGALLVGIIAGFDSGLGANGLYNGNVGISLLVEILLTFIFVITVLGSTSEGSDNAGIVIAFALTAVHLIGISLTGTSVNPARSIGPALFAGGAALANLWVFIVGPSIGGILAGLAWKAFKKQK